MSAKWFLVGCGCFLAWALQAATWYVTTNGSDAVVGGGTNWNTAFLTISNGVAKATAPDTVLVSNGVYTVTAQISISKGITVQSLNGRNVTFVNENQAGVYTYVNHSNALLTGFTITNSSTWGVYLSGGILSNCTISGNAAGLCIYPSAATVKSCIISNNIGGTAAIYIQACTPTIQDSIIINNSSSGLYGGGIETWVNAGGLVTNCAIIGNTCNGGFGGGVCFMGAGSPALTVQNCTIARNAAIRGGGIWGDGSSLRIVNCRISENSASLIGGGVRLDDGYPSILINCLIDMNTGMQVGGVSGNLTLYNCTVVSNVGVNAGSVGGVSLNTTATVRNSIIYFNNAVYAWPTTYSNYSGGTWTNCCMAPDTTGSGNISSNPMFVSMNAGDYHLSKGSPCINTGANDFSWMTNAVDLDGRARIRAGTVDMGAYEWFPKGMIIMLQ